MPSQGKKKRPVVRNLGRGTNDQGASAFDNVCDAEHNECEPTGQISLGLLQQASSSAQGPDDPGYREAARYHDPDRFGFFSVLWLDAARGRKRQASYKLSVMQEAMECLPRDTDAWISQGEFTRPNRQVVNLARIRVCWVDLDTYKTPYGEYSPDQVTRAVLLHLSDLNLPLPTHVLFSGRGLQIKWVLERPIPSEALPRWNAVQRHLAKALESFGADMAAKDASRVLRVVGTVNTRSSRLVREVWSNDELESWDFDLLAEEVLPLSREVIAAKRVQSKGQVVLVPRWRSREEGRLRFSANQLWWDRLADLRHLALLRGWDTDEGVPQGYRDVYLFLSSVALSWAVPQPRIREELTELTHQYCPSFTLSQSRSAVSPVLKRLGMLAKGQHITLPGGRKVDPRYHFANQTLIDWLQIQPREERQLRTIISRDTARERDRQRKQKVRRAAGMVPRVQYEDSARQRRMRAYELFNSGWKVKDIAADLQVTPKAVRWMLHKVETERAQMMERKEATA